MYTILRKDNSRLINISYGRRSHFICASRRTLISPSACMCVKLRSIVLNAYDTCPTIYFTIMEPARVDNCQLSSSYHTGLLLLHQLHIHKLYTLIIPSHSERITNVDPYSGGSKNSLHELEKNATAIPNTAMLLTTLAFSGEVRVLYALET